MNPPKIFLLFYVDACDQVHSKVSLSRKSTPEGYHPQILFDESDMTAGKGQGRWQNPKRVFYELVTYIYIVASHSLSLAEALISQFPKGCTNPAGTCTKSIWSADRDQNPISLLTAEFIQYITILDSWSILAEASIHFLGPLRSPTAPSRFFSAAVLI